MKIVNFQVSVVLLLLAGYGVADDRVNDTTIPIAHTTNLMYASVPNVFLSVQGIQKHACVTNKEMSAECYLPPNQVNDIQIYITDAAGKHWHAVWIKDK